MTTEENKSYAEKNEERIEKAIDKLEDKLTDGEDNKKKDIKSEHSSDK
jgi:hypothetical protein